MNKSDFSQVIRLIVAVLAVMFLCGADRLRETRTKKRFVGEWEIVKDFSTSSCQADFMLRVAHSLTVHPDLSADDDFYGISLKRRLSGPRRLVLRGEKPSLDQSCTTRRQIELTYPSGTSALYRDKSWFICEGKKTCSFSYTGKASRAAE